MYGIKRRQSLIRLMVMCSIELLDSISLRILAMPAISTQPFEGSLHDRALWPHHESNPLTFTGLLDSTIVNRPNAPCQ